MNELDKGMYSILNGATALTTLVNGVYAGIAPQGTACPYVIFEPSTDILMDRTFTSEAVDARYSVKGVSSKLWPKEAMDIQAQIDVVLNNGTPTFTGYARRECRRTHYFRYQDAEGNWHAGGVYRIRAQES